MFSELDLISSFPTD